MANNNLKDHQLVASRRAVCVSKDAADMYRVRTANGDSGVVFVHAWTVPASRPEQQPYYGGHFAAVTSFGEYGATWTHCGLPFLEFLCSLEFDYLMTKAAPEGHYRRYDHDATIASLRRLVSEGRRQGDIGKDDAREVWEALDRLAREDNGGHALITELRDVPKLRILTREPYEFIRETPSANARGFWTDLWPLLLTQWRAEILAREAVVGDKPPASVVAATA